MKRYAIELSIKEAEALEFLIDLGFSDIGNTDDPEHIKHHSGIEKLFKRKQEGKLLKLKKVTKFNGA